MTDSAATGHSLRSVVESVSRKAFGDSSTDVYERQHEEATRPTRASFEAIYDDHVAFIHRATRRLGVHDDAIEDVVQEVFLVVHRRLAEFRHASSLRTWIYGILVRVVRFHQRTRVRAGLHGILDASAPPSVENVADSSARRPDAAVETADAWRFLQTLLDRLGEQQREVFVLAELEQWSVPEIAEALGLKVNTAYSRLRLARASFEAAIARSGEQQ